MGEDKSPGEDRMKLREQKPDSSRNPWVDGHHLNKDHHYHRNMERQDDVWNWEGSTSCRKNGELQFDCPWNQWKEKARQPKKHLVLWHGGWSKEDGGQLERLAQDHDTWRALVGGLCTSKTKAMMMMMIMCNLFNEILWYVPCLQAPVTSTILYHLWWSWWWLWVTMSVESKTCWVHFLTYISTDRDAICCVDKTIEVERLDSSLDWYLLNERK